ncbi:hypothetical protein M9Y10_008175 [Tritrichomonas musculus]|uniref:Non-specific serine/threonine protein kinase n=1 Tax=Tritrichomonas musculus TaxID=1915356 RepID=A0ABR2IXI3_9EUKA
MTEISTTYMITTLIPKIISQLKPILSKFARDFEQHTEKKGKLKVYATPANQALLSNFPHQYQSYAACVNSFVDIAKNSPESAIAVLLKILPERRDNTLYNSFSSQLMQSSTDLLPNLLDLIIILFFADCVAQILTIDPDTAFSDQLFELAYQNISPFTEEYESPLRFTIVKQFSVIFSTLSIRHLQQILSEFSSVSKVSDLSLFFILYRFIHLSINDRNSYDQLHSFLNDFLKLNPLQKFNNKSSPASNSWALAMSPLISQVNAKGNKNLTEIFENVYKNSISKAMGKKPHLNHTILCSNIIVRLESIGGKTCDDFLKEVLFRNKDPHFLEQSLKGFLVIIRGSYVSEFWEWGAFNSNGNPGIELTYLNDPDQDQSLPNSFTNQFLNHFTSLPIEQYPETVSDILLNFAARDFSFFIRSTIPNLRSALGDEKLVVCLQYCLRTIIDPYLHFTEWAQENIRNSSIRIDQSYSLLFNPLKQVIFNDLMKYKPDNQLEESFFFCLTDSQDKPHFELPFKTEPYSKVQKERMLNAERSVENVFYEWGIQNKTQSSWMNIKSMSVQQTTDNEMKVIRILELIPHIVNANDLIANEFGLFLIGMILSDSLAISSFSIRVINQIFAANEDTRIIIYDCIIQKIKSVRNVHHTFMLLQLLVKLLDLSLTINCKPEKIQQFVNNCQPIILYFLTYPFPDFRDYVVILIERMKNFCTIFNAHLAVDEILYKYNPIISAVVRYKIYRSLGKDISFDTPTSYISFREACLSSDVILYRYFLAEIATIYIQLVDIQTLSKTLKLILSLIGEQPTDITSSEHLHYSNTITVLTHLIPTYTDDEKVQKSLQSMKSEFYRFPSHIHNLDKQIITDIRNSTSKIVSLLKKSLNMISADQPPEMNKSNVDLLCFVNGPTISVFMPILTEWLTSTPSQKLHTIIPIASEIWKNVVQTSDLVFSLIVNETGKSEIVHFIRILHKYIQDMKLDIQIPSFNESRQDTTVAINYCIIIQNFIDALALNYQPLNIGPIFDRRTDKWINFSWPIEIRRETLFILFNYSNLTSNSGKIPLLRKQAIESFGSFIQTSELFSQNFTFSRNLRDFVIECLEKKGERVLPSILANNEDLLYDDFVNLMFTENSDISLYYFIAVCSLYYMDNTDESSEEQFVFHIKNSGNLSLNEDSSSELFNFKTDELEEPTESINRFTSILPKIETKVLSEKDIALNKKLMKYSPKILLASFIYLLSTDHYIQKLAYNVILRIVPNIMTIINPNNPTLTLEAMKEFDKMSPLFNSELPSITLGAIQRVCAIFANKIPFLTDVLLNEAFQLMNEAKAGSHLSPSTNGLLLYLIMPLIEKEASYILSNISKEDDYPSSLIIMSPLSFIDGLVSIIPNLERRDFGFYMSIWDKLAKDEEIFDLVLNHFLDIRLQNENGNNDENDNNYFFVADTRMYKYIRIIFSRLVKINSEKVILALTDRLTFAYWYSITIQGNVESDTKPQLPNNDSFNYIYILLSEMIKPFFNQILPRMHLIINFILLHYDQKNTYLTNLMHIILKCFRNCPESLSKIFSLPTSLIWPFELQGNECLIDGNKEFSEADITLQLFAKDSVFVDSFVKDFIKFLCSCNDQKNEKANELESKTADEAAQTESDIKTEKEQPIKDKEENANESEEEEVKETPIKSEPTKQSTSESSALFFTASRQNSMINGSSTFNPQDQDQKPPINNQDLIDNWGKELVEWICGCGDLLLASRASYIFTAILRPMSEDIIKCILRSFCIVVKTVNKENSLEPLVKTPSKSHTPPPQQQQQQQNNEPQSQPPSSQMKNIKSDSNLTPQSNKVIVPTKFSIRTQAFTNFFTEKGRNLFKTKATQLVSSSPPTPKRKSIRLNPGDNSKPNSNTISNHTLSYIVSVLNLLSNYMNIFKTNDNYETVFVPVYRIAYSFLLVSNKNKNWSHDICDAVLPIITKFIITSNSNTSKLKLNKLMLLLTSLTATLRNRDQVYAVFLAIFKHELANEDSELAKSALICFFTFIYIAMGAYHNIPPFSSEMSSSEISKVFECIPLISTGNFVPNELTIVFNSIFSDPASNEPDEFIIKACALVSSEPHDTFIAAAPYLNKMLSECDPNSSLQVAIFATVASLFKAAGNCIDDEFIESFSPIVLVAASGMNMNSPQARELIQCFLQCTHQTTEVPNTIPRLNSSIDSVTSNPLLKDKEDEPKLFEKWGSVIRKVERYTNSIAPISENIDTFINQPLLIVPLNCWNSDISKEIRNLLKIVQFYGPELKIRDKFIQEEHDIQERCDSLSLDSFEPPTNLEAYTAYITV